MLAEHAEQGIVVARPDLRPVRRRVGISLGAQLLVLVALHAIGLPERQQVAHFVETGTAALGLLYDRAVPPTLEAEPLTLQQPYALFAADDPQAQSETLSLNQLAADPLILLDQPLSRDYVTGLFADCGREPNVVMRPSSIELVRSLVANGLGYSVLVTRPAGDLSYDGKQLVVRPLSGNHAPISIALARPKDSPLTQEAAAFTAACSAYLGAMQPC